MNWIIKFRVKRVTKKVNLFLDQYSTLEKYRIYFDQKFIYKFTKRFKGVNNFFNSKTATKFFSKTENNYLINLKKEFIDKFENIYELFQTLNYLLDFHKLNASEFLNELNQIKKNPEDQDSIYLLLDKYQSTFNFVDGGNDMRLEYFSKLMNYYTNIQIYIETWIAIKKSYQDTLKFINLVKEYKKGYINDIKLVHLKKFKESINSLLLKDLQEEITWNKGVISRSTDFINNIDSKVKNHNYEYLETTLSNDFLDIYYNDNNGLLNGNAFYITNKIKRLMNLENIPIKVINAFFQSKHSIIDDRFEEYIHRKLQSLYRECKILTNTYFSTNNDNIPYCQVDLILFYKGQIYVLELKDYSGKIYGNYKGKHWKQIFVSKYKYRSSSRTYTKINKQLINNPIKQNNWHIQILKKICNYPYKNIILFSDNSELFVPNSNVFNYKDFIKYLNNQPIVDDKGLCNEIYYRLCLLNKGADSSVKHQHIKSIKRLHG